MSWYLTLRSDARFTRSTPTDRLVAMLAGLPELAQTGPEAFGGAPGSPWVCVVLAACSPDGGYALTGAPHPQINVVELICSYDGDRGWYESLAARIAAFLGWEAVEEAADRHVWPP